VSDRLLLPRQSLNEEFLQKEREMQQLNEVASELEIQLVAHSSTAKVQSILGRWNDVLTHFRCYQKNTKDKSVGAWFSRLSTRRRCFVFS